MYFNSYINDKVPLRPTAILGRREKPTVQWFLTLATLKSTEKNCQKKKSVSSSSRSNPDFILGRSTTQQLNHWFLNQWFSNLKLTPESPGGLITHKFKRSGIAQEFVQETSPKWYPGCCPRMVPWESPSQGCHWWEFIQTLANPVKLWRGTKTHR